MAYATPAQLRAHYRSGEVDEFASLPDAALERHLERASGAIDRYRPAGTLGPEVLALLTPVCLAIARAYAHDEHVLHEDHPVRRDYDEALRWLKLWSEGRLRLPTSDGTVSTAAAQAPPRELIYGDAFIEAYG